MLSKVGIGKILWQISDDVSGLLFEDFLELVFVDEVEFSSHVVLEVHLGDAGLNLLGSGELNKADFLGDFGHFVTED